MSLRLPSGRILLRCPETVMACSTRTLNPRYHVEFSMLGVKYTESAETLEQAQRLARDISDQGMYERTQSGCTCNCKAGRIQAHSKRVECAEPSA